MALQRRRWPQPGQVYVLATRHSGVVKVGHTTVCPHRRAAALSRQPGYRGFAPLTVAWAVAVPDCRRVERLAHRLLRRRRIRLHLGCREMFRVDVATACRAIETAAIAIRPKPPQWRRCWFALARAAARLRRAFGRIRR
ncbi:GIY-YIG nuclease family protein [Paracraurococcus lichenis]|uniref:GIY-YIG nuclease family protein n=1 Tax=Paracraurococcus lichenis TaxID=3064888 RepID=UPI00351D35A9